MVGGDIVNLRRERKRRTKAVGAATAAANRLTFGRSKTEISRSEIERSLADKHFEGHRLTDDDLPDTAMDRLPDRA